MSTNVPVSPQPAGVVAHSKTGNTAVRSNWSRDEVAAIYRAPLPELIFRAQTFHRQFHAADRVQTCQLISIKTVGARKTVRIARKARITTRMWNAKACWTRNTSFWWLAKPLDAE